MVRNKYKVVGVSFSGTDDLLERAKRRARSQGRSFSNYVIQLIRQDLDVSGQYPEVLARAQAMNEAPVTKSGDQPLPVSSKVVVEGKKIYAAELAKLKKKGVK